VALVGASVFGYAAVRGFARCAKTGAGGALGGGLGRPQNMVAGV